MEGKFTNTVFVKLKKILQDRFTSQWIILTIDILIISLLFVLFCNLWRLFSDQSFPNRDNFSILGFVFVGSMLISEAMLKTFNRVIRYHGIKDTINLFLASCVSSIILYIVLKYTGIVLYSDIMLVILIFVWQALSFFALFLFRIAVRFVYFIMIEKGSGNNKKAAFLYADTSKMAPISTIKSSYGKMFVPTVLFTPQVNFKGGTIDGAPVEKIDETSILNIIRKYKIDVFIFFPSQLNLVKESYADILLKNNVELMIMELADPMSANSSSTLHKVQIEDLLGREVITLNNELVEDNICGSVVMVTGAAGSVGSEIVRQVCSYRCNTIIIFDIAETPLNSLWLELKDTFSDIDIMPIIGDVTDINHLDHVFSTFKPDIVYHAAAYKHVPVMEMHPMKAVQVNVLGSKNVADTAVKYNTNMVMISTDKAVNPTNVMGATKRVAEIYVQALFYENKLRCENIGENRFPRLVITRFGNVLGSNGSVVPLFKNQIEHGGPITITHKDVIRYFMTIREACSLVLEAGCMGKGGEVFVFDMGNQVRIYDLAEKMIRLSGKIPHVDIKIKEIGLRDGEKLYEELLTNNDDCMPTYNKKIQIIKTKQIVYNHINNDITQLAQILQSRDNMKIVKQIKNIVPEYKSNNSVFSQLD